MIDQNEPIYQYNQVMRVIYTVHIKGFTRAGSIGDWKGHLATMGKILNLFVVAGHINYSKKVRLFLQKMTELETEYLWLYQQFSNKAFYCVSRTENFWAGLWSDLVIEQTMMRSPNSLSGLTRGRGIEKNTRTLWAAT